MLIVEQFAYLLGNEGRFSTLMLVGAERTTVKGVLRGENNYCPKGV